jgi:hypothetical protein
MTAGPGSHSPAAASLDITTSRQMPAWLDEQKRSIAPATHQFGKLFLLGCKPSGELSVPQRSRHRTCAKQLAPRGGRARIAEQLDPRAGGPGQKASDRGSQSTQKNAVIVDARPPPAASGCSPKRGPAEACYTSGLR